MKNSEYKNKTIAQSHSKRLLLVGLILFTFIFMLSFTSASISKEFTQDTSRQLEKGDLQTNYGKIVLTDRSWYDVLGWWEKEIKEIELKENTPTCSNNCFAELEINLKEKGTLVEDVLFKRSFDNQKTWVDWTGFINWRILVEEEFDVFETNCINGKEIIDDKNGTSYFEQECSQTKTGTEKRFIPIDYKKEYDVGVYNIRLEGSKKGSTVLDWMIKTNGVVLNEWAIWGNISEGDEAEVILNSPTNSSTSLTSSVIFNASANVINGVYLTNMSFCSDITGSWGCGDSVDIPILDNSNYGDIFTNMGETPANCADGNTETNCGGNNGQYYGRNFSLSNISYVTLKQYSLYTTGNLKIQTKNAGGTWSDLAGSSRSNPKDPTKANENFTINFPVTGVRTVFEQSQGGYMGEMTFSIIANYLNSSTQTWTKTIPAGTTTWNIQACDSDGDCGFAPSNFTVTLDSIEPTIEINSGDGTLDYGSLVQNHTINFTVTDDNIDECWYSYNGEDSSDLGCSTGVIKSFNFPLVKDQYSATIYANDTAGNLVSEIVDWGYKVFENNRSYNATTFQTTQETFTLNLTTDGTQIPIIYLVYDGERQLATRNENIFTNILDISDVGVNTFYWEVNYGSLTFNTTSSNQTVLALTGMEIKEGACSAGLTQVMNFTFKDEENLTALTNMIFKYNIKYGISDTSGAEKFGQLTGVSQVSLCLNVSESPIYDIGFGEINYLREGYSERRYYIFENTRLSNNTQNISLYSLTNADSTSFLVEIRAPTLTPLTGKYTTLLRWYPDLDEYKVVEMGRTDDKGQTIKKVKTEDVDYRIGIYETNGLLIQLINPIRMVCLVSPCSYTITVKSSSGVTLEEITNIESSLTYSAGVFTYVYNDPSQNTDEMTLKVFRISGTRDIPICTSNSTEFTGILTCNVSEEEGILKAVAYRTASPTREIASLIIDTTETIFQGTFGLFIQFMVTITLIFLGIISPVVAIILGLISIIFGVLVFKTLTYPIMIGLGILGGILIHFMRRSGGR